MTWLQTRSLSLVAISCLLVVGLTACSAVTEFDRSKIGAGDGGGDASGDASRDATLDATPDASESCLGVDCSHLDGECVLGVCREGTCFADARATGTSCDDGLTCTENDACNSQGVCEGITRACDDGLTCTMDSCDEEAGCQHETSAGSCVIDGTCFDDEALNPENDCQFCASEVDNTTWTNRSLGSSCDDGLFCTDVDQCDGEGVCDGTERDCSDANLCNIDACDEDADMCTHMASTSNCNIGGNCVANGVVNPNNSCQVCDPSASSSQWTNLGEDAPCSDGNACTVGDACNASATCVPGAAKSCDDSLSCTTDSCNTSTGQCLNTLANNRCLIGNVCYNNNQGRAGFPCQRCESATPNQWSNRAVDTDCDNGNACTSNDKCDDNGACQAGGAVNCDDSNPCTSNGCNPSTGCTTQNIAMGMGCNDGNACTMADQCNGSGSCGGSAVTCPDDNNVCTVESCDPDDGCGTTPAANTVDCDDGNMCTSGNKCNGAGVCGAGTPVVCDDGDVCNGSETCVPATGCQPGMNLMCVDDGDPCTVESCDPDDGCVSTPAANTVGCDDGNPCTMDDKCNGAGACGAGTLLDCGGATGACSQITCNPNRGDCFVDNGTTCGGGMCNDGVCSP